MSELSSPSPAASFRRDLLLCITAFLLVAIVQTIAMRFEGRIWWCACGEAFLYSHTVNSMHNSQHLVDAYSLSHVLHGVIFYFAMRLLPKRVGFVPRFSIAMLIEAGWEILENSPVIINRYRAATVSLGYEGDSIGNSVGDLGSAAIGFLIAWKIGWRWSLALFAASELFMLWWIRDNLTLNVLMLIYPIDAIRQWQSQ